MSAAYGQYGTLASYFGQSGGTNSPGRAGGAGYNSDLTTGGSTQGDTQQASAQSGSGWISAAASTDSTDKSNFSTPFQQGFGGIANNQVYVVGSPGAGVTSAPSAAPVTAPPVVGNAAPGGLFGGSNSFVVLALAGLAAILLAKVFR